MTKTKLFSCVLTLCFCLNLSIGAVVTPQDVAVTLVANVDYMDKMGGYFAFGGSFESYLGIRVQSYKKEPTYVFFTYSGGLNGDVNNRKVYCEGQQPMNYRVSRPVGSWTNLVNVTERLPQNYAEFNQANDIMKFSGSGILAMDSFHVYVPTPQPRNPGTLFVDDAVIKGYLMTDNGPVLIGSFPVKIRVPIRNVSSIQSGGNVSLDLGIIQKQQRMPLIVDFTYNGNYIIYARAKYGSLRHQNENVQTQIPYKFYNSYGQEYALSTQEDRQVFSGYTTRYTRESFRMDLYPYSGNFGGNYDQAVSGRYTEEITFSLAEL